MQFSHVWELYLLYSLHGTFATFMSYVPSTFMHDLACTSYCILCMLCSCSIYIYIHMAAASCILCPIYT